MDVEDAPAAAAEPSLSASVEPSRAQEAKLAIGDPSPPRALSISSCSEAGKFEVSFNNLEYSVLVPAAPRPKISALADPKLAPARPGFFKFIKRAPKEKKIILKSITGKFRAGRFTAILGPSGSGKTTLLSAIGGHNLGGTLAGEICVNGHPVTSRLLRAMGGFVFQDDVVLATMTVGEAMAMALALRRKPMDAESFRLRVDDMLVTLGLEKSRDTIIGSALTKGISGGERKRTAIGMELMAGPPVLLLDEYTSGLDSFTAYKITQILKRLTTEGSCTVIATIHQPSSEILALIDDVMILVSGEILYYGSSSKMVPYFANLGYACPQFSNPADYIFMDVINNTSDDEKRKLYLTAKESYKSLLEAENELKKNCRANDANGTKSTTPRLWFKYFPSTFQQFHYLVIRSWKNLARNKMLFRARFAQSVFIAILVGCVYYDITNTDNGHSAQLVARSVNGALFFLSTNMFITSGVSSMSTFFEERQVVTREYSLGYYTVPPYFAAKLLVELPAQLFIPFAASTVQYWMIGYSRDPTEYILFTAIGILLAMVGSLYGIMVAASIRDLAIGLAVLPATMMPLMLLSGFLASNSLVPDWLRWIEWVSPIQYSFTGLMRNYWEKKSDGKEQLDEAGISDRLDLGWNYLVLGGFIVFNCAMALLGLIRVVRKLGGSPILPQSTIKAWTGGAPDKR